MNITVGADILGILVTGLLVYYLYLKHKERIEMIRMRELYPEDNVEQKKLSLLSKAFLAFSLALGLITGQVLTSYFPDQHEVILYAISILSWGGIGLLIFYFIRWNAIRKIFNILSCIIIYNFL